MAYPTLADVNTSEGMHVIFTYANDITGGLLVNATLFAFFVIIMMSTYFSQQRVSGKGDMPSSFAVAGYLTGGLAILFSLIPNFINTTSVVMVIVIATIGTLWLFLSRGKD
jgi:hypothetical protein|tara:strand:+ start:102 stop:434 length:333 start_codon:yes stop_codon:yes gene_type:complete